MSGRSRARLFRKMYTGLTSRITTSVKIRSIGSPRRAIRVRLRIGRRHHAVTESVSISITSANTPSRPRQADCSRSCGRRGREADSRQLVR